MSLVGNTNEQKIWNYFKAKGLNDYGISGLLGNLYAESTLNSKNLQSTGNSKLNMTDEQYTNAVDNGSYTNFVKDGFGYGLAQWTYHSRKQGLLDYIKSKNKSIGDLESQLDYLWKELSWYPTVLNTLKTATSVLQASNEVLFKYEQPADQSSSVQNKRCGYGKTYYDKYAKSSTAPTQSSQSTTNVSNMSVGEKGLREKVVSIAQSYYGCKESDGSHKPIIDIYNSATPLPRGYKMTYADPWCATFVSAVGIKAGLSDIIPRECGCGEMITLYQNLKRWVENDAHIPQIGDIVFYDWDDNGVGDNVGWSDHVGIVVSISGNEVKVIEGNKNNSVDYRTLKVNDKYIRGYGVPNYASKAAVVNTTPTTPTAPSTPSAPTPPTSPKFKLGDRVRLVSGATYTSGKSIPSWVFEYNLYVRGINGDSITVSTLKTGAITGVVSAKYLTLVSATTANNKPSTENTSYQVRITADALNIRSGAGSNYSINGVIRDKGIYTIVAEAIGQGATKWGKLKSGAGWISLDYTKRI